MAYAIGTKGVIEVKEHFMGFTTTTMGTTKLPVGANGVMYCSVQEGAFALTTDEPGGVLSVTCDDSSGDNCCLYIGPFKPADGGVVFETRFKVNDITSCAVFVGFAEDVNATTPVLPLSFSTATMAYNDSGNMAGLSFDSNATSGTADWRASGGNASAAATNAYLNGTRANNAPVNDKYDVVQVKIDPAGNAEMYLADDNGGLRLIERIESCVTATDLTNAVLMIENRSAAASILEVDYMYAKGYRDWTV